MDLYGNAAALRVAHRFFMTERTDCGEIPYTPSKTNSTGKEEETDFPFPRVSPERVGIPREVLTSFLRQVGGRFDNHPHAVLLLKDGKCVVQAALPGYSVRRPHMTFSMCKSVTGMAVGFLREEKGLDFDAPLLSFFPEYAAVSPARAKKITVRHLLTMKSGAEFAEVGSVTSENWVRSFFTSGVKFEPGTAFAYNSMNTFMLSALVCRLTGESLNEYLRPRLWEPLHIPVPLWEKEASGVEKGGWGLYLCPVAMAKLGLTFLNGGKYDGKQVLPLSYLEDAAGFRTAVPDRVGAYDYGYQMWTEKNGKTFLFNGMLGQNVFIYPEKNMVLVMTGGDEKMFQDTFGVTLARELFEAPFPPCRFSPKARRAFRKAEASFGEAGSFIGFRATKETRRNAVRGESLTGTYRAPFNRGVFPAVTQLMQNNFTPGFSVIKVEKTGKKPLSDLRLTLTDGETETVFPVGICSPRYKELDVNGEKYLVAGLGEWVLDVCRRPVLKIELRYGELASAKRLVFRRDDATGEVILTLSETPGFPVLTSVLESAAAQAQDGFLDMALSFIKERKSLAAFTEKAKEVFCTDLTLTKEEPNDEQ
ncbi:MAG: beta-lactamase family protein [Clostridia bacterium]|nr:beta-lactamase family protein [Clostridia bacterium]